VWRVPWDTHHHGPLHPDEVALAPHRQHTATLAGQAFTMLRTSGWQRPGGPSGQLVPGIAEVLAYASKPREGEGPFIPEQAFDREARFGEPDEDYDRSRDMPRIIELDGSVIVASRAVEMDIELDNEGVPTTTVEVPLTLGGVDTSDLMAWRIEPGDRSEGQGAGQGEGLLVALRMADGTERVAVLGADLVELAPIDASLPGVGASYEVNGRTFYGVADVIQYEGELFAALAGGENEPRSGLWVARLSDSALTRELALVEVDTTRCLGPYPRNPGSCGSGVSPNTQGCTYFACPRLARMWLPQEGGAVEVARLAVDADGLQVTYAVRFPEGWSRDLLDRGRIRTAVFTLPPFAAPSD